MSDDLILEMQKAATDYLCPSTYARRSPGGTCLHDSEAAMPDRNASPEAADMAHRKRDEMFIADIIYFLDSREHGTNIRADHARELEAAQGVAVKPLDENARAEITEAAYIAMRRNQRGAKGQLITEWDGIESWVIVETERRIRSALTTAPVTVDEALVTVLKGNGAWLHRWAQHFEEAAARIRELEQGVAVKPLEWEDHPADGGPVISKAVTLTGTYFICDDTDDFSGLYLQLVGHDRAQWWQHVRSTCETLAEGIHDDDLTPIKAVAQADYEARIRSALTPAPVTVSEAARHIEKEAGE